MEPPREQVQRPIREAQEGEQEKMQEEKRSGGEHDQGERNKTAKTSTEETEREREGRRENRGVRNSRNRKQNRRAATRTEGVIKLEKGKSTGKKWSKEFEPEIKTKKEKGRDRGTEGNMPIRILTNSHFLLDPSSPRRRRGAGGTRDTRWGERGHRVPGLPKGHWPCWMHFPKTDRASESASFFPAPPAPPLGLIFQG